MGADLEEMTPVPTPNPSRRGSRPTIPDNPDADSIGVEIVGDMIEEAPATVDLGASQKSKKGEDYWQTLEAQIGGETVWFGMVADGHGGKHAAQLCRKEMIGWIIERTGGNPSGKSLRNAGREAFLHAHAQACSTKGVTSGTTLTICAVNLIRQEITTIK